MQENDLPRVTVRMNRAESAKLQRAWTQSGNFANRSQYIKAAVNAYAGEQIFDTKEKTV